jgi:transglutaminase-like putative cysteine protease
MKVVNKIMIGIAVLCLLLCGGILVFALNPDMTSSLAQKLYGNTVDMPPGTEETGEGQTSGNGNISVTLPNGMPGEMNGYVAPSMDQMQIPEDVSGRTGFTPVQPEEQQIPDQEAQNLKETLGSGETGEGLSFSAEEYPYYQMLSENQQSVYRQIYANAQNLTEKFAPEKTVSASDVKTAFEAVIGDHPEMFWLETGYSSKYLANGQCVEIDLKYNGTADDLESAKQRFDAAAQNLITGAASLDSNYEKEKYVHDALASAVTYDLTADMNQSAYSALVNGKSVCAGYARAYQYLLQQLGIPCYYCTGYSGGDHAWNIVKLEDGYYNVDVTWDDAAAIRYDYFNKTDADFASTHVRQNLSVYLPACNGTAYRQENTTGAVGTGQPSEAGGATPDPDAGTTPSGGQTDGSVTDPGQQGDGTQESEQPGSSLSDYINPDPQEPLRYPSGNTAGSAGNTTAAATPEPRADALTDLSSYYEDCRKQLTGLGSGDQHFDNVVPKSLWSTIEQSYHTGAYEQGYVVDVLKNFGMEYFAIQLQLVDIGDGYYRVYHNVVTY